ncbi:MAG: bifunctional metallophosphatase/5'-nucleotidase [Liquorilactobacillus mali]|uniref:bifunctional metallophosphatase/5'-nucleotidase n=1 Tax=Liquorilactobacillus mali TaxID=1618 RepID=UPI0039EB6619
MQIKILVTSDIHGYMYPTTYLKRHENQDIGFAKCASVIENVRKNSASEDLVLVIDNGDYIQGSALVDFLFHKGNYQVKELVQAENIIKYDAAILGNHEFNYGRKYQEKINSYRKHPILCANILDDDSKPYMGKAYEIFEEKGVRVAILGLTTQYIPHWETQENIHGLYFKSAVQTAKEYIPRLRKIADIVIVAYHGGFEADENGIATEELTGENEAYELSKIAGIDALITGHQHRKIATFYNDIPVIQPGYAGEVVGAIELEYRDSVITKKTAKLLSTRGIDPNNTVINLLESDNKDTEEWLDKSVGVLDKGFKLTDVASARLHGHPFIDLMNYFVREATGVDIVASSIFNNQQPGFAQMVTMRDIKANYPFSNTFAVLEVTGKDLLAALEQTAMYWGEEEGRIVVATKNGRQRIPDFNYDIYGGIDYTINVSQPQGKRITNLCYQGHKIVPEDTLKIGLSKYRAMGGGDYQMFDASKIISESEFEVSEVIVQVLTQNKKISPKNLPKNDYNVLL